MARRLLMVIGVLSGIGIFYVIADDLFVSDKPSFGAFVAGQLGQDASPLPDSWGTYRNERFGFEVRYPEGYAYKDDIELKNEEEEFAVFFYSADQGSAVENEFTGLPKFTVLKVRNADKVPLDGWVAGRLSQAGEDVEDDVVFGDNHFMRISYSGAGPFYVHLLAEDDAVFMVSTPQYNKEAPGEYSRILSSFRAL